MSDSTAPRTFTVAMARARHPAVGRNRIYTALQSGVLPSVVVGKRIAIDVDDLDHWVMSGCPAPPKVADGGARALDRLLSAAPPLSSEQVDRLRVLLHGQALRDPGAGR
jgi:hypothetical protein